MIESVAGFIIAAPTPWTTRARDQDVSPFGASPQASDEAVKIDQADDEDPPAAEQVGELAAGEHEHGEGEA